MLNALKVKSAKNLIAKKVGTLLITLILFIIFDDCPKKSKINKTKNNIADFNMSNFSDLKLKVFNTFLNTSDQMVMVKFLKIPNCSRLLFSFRVNKGNVKNYKNEDFFLISPNNLKNFIWKKAKKLYWIF